MARTRETPPGPTGTARIPVVRQAPTDPRAPRPEQREQQQQPEAPRPEAPAPARSRLRTPPTAPPQQAPSTRPPVRPAAPQPFGQLSPSRPAVPPSTTRPFSQLAPAVAPTPPTPIDVTRPPTATRRRRRPVRGFIAALAVLALGALWTLPSFASEALDAPPVAGVSTSDVQTFQVGAEVEPGAASADGISGSLAAAAPAVAAAPSWIAPVVGHLGDPFGPRPEQPVPGVNLFHRGQDIVAPCGEQIHAAASGTVTMATWWGTYGNWILIDHGDGVAVGYAHESQILVSPGQHVSVGQVIGIVGETGAATGCHLHLEVHLNGVAVNPVPFFAAKRISLG
ncbi:MAG: M23 family metallopeptidase [Acidobacteria bacterium]|nr:M23 family metallopeptidase [Acidobacteriota bacterium]